MIQSNARMQTDTMFAAMAILAVMAVLLRLVVDLSTANLAPWAKETEHTISFSYLRRLSTP